MKYIRILIAVLILILIGIGGYYVYLLLNFNKSLKTSDFETEMSFNIKQNTPIPPTNSKLVSKFHEYTSTDSANSGVLIRIQGSLQAVDPVEKVINGVPYSYVIGIREDGGSLSKIWLTTSEYEGIRTNIPDWGIPGVPVILTLNQREVNFEINLPQ